MKKTISLLAFLLLVTVLSGQIYDEIYGQTINKKSLSKEDYLRTYKTQKIVANVLLVTGTTMAVVGMIGYDNNRLKIRYSEDQITLSSGDGNTEAYARILAVGLLMDIVSVPFFISASKNKNRAAKLVINNQVLYQPNGSLSVYQNPIVPSLTLKIRF